MNKGTLVLQLEVYVLARNLTKALIIISPESILFSKGQFLLRIFNVLFRTLHLCSLSILDGVLS